MSAHQPGAGVRLGFLGVDVGSPASWSGSPAGLLRGLRDIGAEVRLVDAELPALGRAILRPLGPRGSGRRDRSGLALTLREWWVRARLRRAEPEFAAWIQLGSECGTPLRGKFATFDDMTVAQAVRLQNPYFAAVPSASLRRWEEVQRRLYERAAACCVATHWARTSLIDDYGVAPARAAVVGIGADLEVRPVARDWASPRLLFVGADWERKNGEAVVWAFRRLREEIPAAHLDIVGDHPRIDDPGVAGHGRLDRSDPTHRNRLIALFETATCFVMPSFSEPFGIAYVEAAAAGVPSVGTTVGGAAEPIGDGGLVVDPLDREAILEALRRLSDPAVARAAGARARRRASLFTWPKVAERVLRALGLGDPTALAEFVPALPAVT